MGGCKLYRYPWRMRQSTGVTSAICALAGPMRETHYMVQSWIAEPAPLEDLRKAETEWMRLSRTIEALKEAGVTIPQVP